MSAIDIRRSVRCVGALLVAVAGVEAPAEEKDVPTYEKITKTPSAYARESSLAFTMQFRGLKEVEECFSAVGRNASTHVELATPAVRGAREKMPIFVSKSKSGLVRKLRDLPEGDRYFFRGRMRYFKTDYYPKEETPAKGSLVNIEVNQSIALADYFLSSLEEPQGEVIHYIFDLSEFREIKPDERPPGEAPAQKQAPAKGYRAVRPAQLPGEARELAGIPIRFEMRYRGKLGRLLESAGGGDLAALFGLPSATCVRETDLERAPGDPASDLVLVEAPGPLGKLVAIAYGESWEVASDLAGIESGDTVEVRGMLYQGPAVGAESRFVFLLEGVEKVGSRRER